MANERSLFLALLEIADPRERSAYLEQACAGHTRFYSAKLKEWCTRGTDKQTASIKHRLQILLFTPKELYP